MGESCCIEVDSGGARFAVRGLRGSIDDAEAPGRPVHQGELQHVPGFAIDGDTNRGDCVEAVVVAILAVGRRLLEVEFGANFADSASGDQEESQVVFRVAPRTVLFTSSSVGLAELRPR